jgi:hypothetical protein
VVAEASKLTGDQLAAHLEREGLKLADFERWRIALENDGNGSTAAARRIRQLEREPLGRLGKLRPSAVSRSRAPIRPVVAMMLEANPRLSVRDIEYLPAKTWMRPPQYLQPKPILLRRGRTRHGSSPLHDRRLHQFCGERIFPNRRIRGYVCEHRSERATVSECGRVS